MSRSPKKILVFLIFRGGPQRRPPQKRSEPPCPPLMLNHNFHAGNDGIYRFRSWQTILDGFRSNPRKFQKIEIFCPPFVLKKFDFSIIKNWFYNKKFRERTLGAPEVLDVQFILLNFTIKKTNFQRFHINFLRFQKITSTKQPYQKNLEHKFKKIALNPSRTSVYT